LNGAGKTAILDAILLLLSNYQECNKNIYTPDDIYIGSALTENEIILRRCDYRESWQSTSNHEEIKEKSNINVRKPINNRCDISVTSSVNGQSETEYFLCFYYKTDKKNIYLLADYFSCETNFINFEEWFKNEEDLENELQRDKKDFNFTTPRLDIIRKAITTFITNITGADFSDLRVKRSIKDRNVMGSQKEEIDKHSFDLCITHNKKELKLSQLSEGQRLLLHRVGDIAYQLVKIHNVSEETKIQDDAGESDYVYMQILDVLKTSGIVLIDEIELHLHPQWQRAVLPALQETFPNIQFIVTTHSPQILSNVKKEEIFILEDGALVKNTPHTQGRDSNSILYELFGVEERPKIYRDKINAFYDALEDEKIVEAKEILAELTELFGEQDTEIVRANLHLDFATE
jgi:predicted ATP-binding protein involved in virulence